MKLVNVIYFAATLLIFGCSSNSISTNYYLLNNQPTIKQTELVNNKEGKKKQLVVLKIKDLPEYLEQPHLVIQMAEHQLHYANFHMWAEPLKKGFKKALLAEMSNSSLAIDFISERDVGDKNLLNTKELIVEVDFFHATAKSQVILSGRYQLKNISSLQRSKVQSFNLMLPLNVDGYAHSIAQMRVLVKLLASQIISQEFKSK